MNSLMQMPLFSAGLALVGLVLTAGCGEKSASQGMPEEELRGDVWAIPVGNSLGGLPGPIHESQAASVIHWQPWTKASLEMAENSRRLVLAVVALPQQPTFVDILENLSSDPATVALINDTYVPILIDGDAVREIGILTAELCAEVGSGLQLPLLVWMTSEGNPVAWMPLPSPGVGSASELLAQSHTMVARTWVEDPGYVTINSRLDQVNRSERMAERLKDLETSDEPSADALRALRQLTSLYDPVSRTFDEVGGLFPVGALDLLAMASGMEDLPEDLRGRSQMVLDSLLDDLLVSPMFDPLDGGVFNSRSGATWQFPSFYRDCASQARVIVGLLNAYEASGDKRALDRAMGVLRFVEKNCATDDGLFRFDAGATGSAGEWLWFYEDVSGALSAEELAVWMQASGMRAGGNLPSEADPLREYFRGNSIAFAKSAEEIAAAQGIDPARVKELLASSRAKLLEERNKRLEKVFGVGEPNAAATFRMISAYASAYRITGETEYRDQASETLAKAKRHFAKGPHLNVYAGGAADSLVAARAFVYGVAIQAALDVEAVTLDGVWLLWAGDLASTVSEEFSAGTYVRECPPRADLTGLPVTDLAMLFDESTAGLLSMSQSRMEALGIPLVPALKAKLSALPMASITNPMLHTDVIQATLMRDFAVTYVYGKDTPQTLKDAIARSPLKGVNRRAAKPMDPARLSPKPDEALRIAPGGKVSPVRAAGDINVPSLP